jgi:hypothetical protein
MIVVFLSGARAAAQLGSLRENLGMGKVWLMRGSRVCVASTLIRGIHEPRQRIRQAMPLAQSIHTCERTFARRCLSKAEVVLMGQCRR